MNSHGWSSEDSFYLDKAMPSTLPATSSTSHEAILARLDCNLGPQQVLLITFGGNGLSYPNQTIEFLREAAASAGYVATALSFDRTAENFADELDWILAEGNKANWSVVVLIDLEAESYRVNSHLQVAFEKNAWPAGLLIRAQQDATSCQTMMRDLLAAGGGNICSRQVADDTAEMLRSEFLGLLEDVAQKILAAATSFVSAPKTMGPSEGRPLQTRPANSMSSSADGTRGQILTFYSYKGGTGRTMLLANVAWIIATNGYKVLVIDWDLEAPGLHLYLQPFLTDTALHDTPGIIDFVRDAAKKIVTRMDPAKATTARLTNSLSLENYIVGLDYEFPSDGLIDFIPAGRQSALYAQRVNTFDWENFYARLGGGKILQAARDSLRHEYDFILIDSRTGVSDTSSICTVQRPDKVVICFTLNRQSIDGAGSIAGSIREQKGRQFKIYPVPTRLENAETDKRDRALRFAKSIFRECVAGLQGTESSLSAEEEAKYWADVQVPYRTFYAFEEIPAVFKDVPLERGTILDASESIASRLIGRSIKLSCTIPEGVPP